MIRSFTDVENELRKIKNELDYLRTHNIDLNKRRIINAHPSIDLYDYVVRKELQDLEKRVSLERTGEIQGEIFYKATFGLNDASFGEDKTPHFFVLNPGRPMDIRANAKVAPFANNWVCTIFQSKDESVTWKEILKPEKRLVIPQGSTKIHILSEFADDVYLEYGDLLRIDVTVGDAANVCREVEVVLRWK